MQDTVLAVHLKQATWDPARPFTPWLNAVARHKAIDAIRRKGGRIDVEIDNVAHELSGPEENIDVTVDVKTALAALDERQRTIVARISSEGQSASEVGAARDMTEGTMRVAWHRALKVKTKRLNGSTP